MLTTATKIPALVPMEQQQIRKLVHLVFREQFRARPSCIFDHGNKPGYLGENS